MLPSDSFQGCSFIINQVAWAREYVIILKNVLESQLLKKTKKTEKQKTKRHVLDRCGSREKGL